MLLRCHQARSTALWWEPAFSRTTTMGSSAGMAWARWSRNARKDTFPFWSLRCCMRRPLASSTAPKTTTFWSAAAAGAFNGHPFFASARLLPGTGGCGLHTHRERPDGVVWAQQSFFLQPLQQPFGGRHGVGILAGADRGRVGVADDRGNPASAPPESAWPH
jgi:hypothetical protein